MYISANIQERLPKIVLEMSYFTVNVLEATGLKETEVLGKQDPYVEIRTNSDRKYTSTHQNGGKNPSMN